MDLSSIPANDLAKLCSDANNADAWNEFVRRFQKPIALVVLRTARGWGSTSISLLDDLVQDTFLRLCKDNCKLLKTFVAREPDSIVGYLKVIAENVTHDHFRTEKSQKRGGHLQRVERAGGDLDFLISAPGESNPTEKAIQVDEIDRALQSFVPATLSERDRTIFWLYYEQGFSARDIGAIAALGLTIKGVESSIHRSTTQLREAMRRPTVETSAPAKGFSGVATIFKENE